MGNVAFNVAKGKHAYYAELGAAADALIAVPLEATGLEADAVLVDYDDLGSLLAAASNEQTTMGRKTLTGVTVTVDDTNNLVKIDCADVVWSAATGNATGALLVCYDGDTGAGTDANIVPLFKYDFAATPAGGDITAVIHANGLGSVS